MAPELVTGVGLTLLGGIFAGICMLPMKFPKRLQWENTWLLFSVVALLILPWSLGWALAPRLGAVYASLPWTAFLAPLGFSTGWGVAQVLFGLSIARLGLALAYAIIIGLGTVLGALVPLFVKARDVVGTWRGHLIFAGIGVMVLGIVLSAWAGRMRESAASGARTSSYGSALLLAILCGVLAPMLNYAFAFGESIADAAKQQGATPGAAVYAVWPIALLGGLVVNVAYACWLLSRNRTWANFGGAWRSEAWAGCLMGALWMAAMAVYGASSVYLGALGTSVGWALFQTFMIMTANLSGVLTGEWKQASAAARRRLWFGLALLAAAIVVISLGNA